MHVEFKTDGGLTYFPGLAAPVDFDSEQLANDDAEELARLVDAVDFFQLPAVVGEAAPGAADYRTYTVTIDTGSQRHSVRAVEPLHDPALQELIRFLEARVRALRAARGQR